MDSEVIIIAVLIALARIVDVSLGTMRLIFITRGSKIPAFFFGLAESAIWVVAVSKVTTRLDEPILIAAFAMGFAMGNYIGLTIEQFLAFGHLMVRVFTRKGAELSKSLRDAGWRITRFPGEGRDGPVDMLFMKIKRKERKKLFRQILAMDPSSYFIIDDVHSFDRPPPLLQAGKQWFRISKRK